jgi:prevent-host-death family protein
MPRIVTAEDLRAHLGRELDALKETEEALYVSKRGRLTAVVLDSEHYAALIDRLEYLEDSLAALDAREDRATVDWAEIRE